MDCHCNLAKTTNRMVAENFGTVYTCSYGYLELTKKLILISACL